MNKTLTFFTAPLTALFYPRVYRDAVQSSAGRGILYALYVAALTIALIMMFISARVMPKINGFVDWTKANMPVMVWTPAGLSLENGQTTAMLKHPQYGTIAVFDMTKTAVTAKDMEDTYLLVTAQKIFMKRAPGQIEERDITAAGLRSSQQLPPKVRIAGDFVSKFFQNIKNSMAFVIPFVLLPLFFVLILVTNLFYSLAGLLFNLLRQNKLRYGAIFNLSCFSASAAFVPTWIFLTIVSRPFPLWAGLLINLGYLLFAFKITDKDIKTA